MEAVGEAEVLARFLTQSKHFNTQGVTQRAFMPDPYDDLSVSRINGLEASEIAARGEASVSERGANLYGWGEINVTAVLSQGLTIRPDEPPPGHAVIIGWPEEKEARKLIAIKLAAAARLRSLP